VFGLKDRTFRLNRMQSQPPPSTQSVFLQLPPDCFTTHQPSSAAVRDKQLVVPPAATCAACNAASNALSVFLPLKLHGGRQSRVRGWGAGGL